MAEVAPRRRMNVRSSSSCSSVDSTENSFDIEYMSDNSTNKVTSANSFHLLAGEFDCSEIFDTVEECSFKTPRVLKKEFVFDVDRMKQEENDPFAHKSSKRQPKCFSKNAVMARQNRVKQKKYLENLKQELSSLSDENRRLKELIGKNDDVVNTLKSEVKFLKNVIANSKEVGMLLKCVNFSTGLPVRSSLLKHQKLNKELDIETDYEQDTLVPSDDTGLNLCSEEPLLSPIHGPVLPQENAAGDLGICLHVAKKRVSLEFCSSCNSKGQAAWEDNVF